MGPLRQPAEEHLNHAIQHVIAYLEGNTTEDDLGHAAARMLMACHADKHWPTQR